ncbi:MAG: hypothetical protein CL868_16020 [Cytophagaceae bacterium]|nr:hypothetical protein [Cytophagaceae bacterium]|tara:strand:- start:158 stop:451 length:294 start_codon:yes stop_codon:yes gene_type:complete
MFRFYIDVTKFALAFCTLLVPLMGVLQGILVFGIFGTPLGLIGFYQFHKSEFFTYYNLGHTKRELILKTWMFNLILMIPLFLLYLLGSWVKNLILLP